MQGKKFCSLRKGVMSCGQSWPPHSLGFVLLPHVAEVSSITILTSAKSLRGLDQFKP